ncbi:major capsid protein [Bartonella rattaustraliani]|uniref:major capsid protein n=1 Tax=Bartonella rattaustraliani TaxID=481139 RepID=UPI0002DE31C4|nr:minor capsid protein E [Bartonella rattaustraliani]
MERPASFLLDTFFGSIQTEEAEEIHFDIDQSKPRLAPFVSPFVAGCVVANEGFTTQSFKPAYVKDKRRFDANMPLKRSIGEKIGGALPASRRSRSAQSVRKSYTS